MANLLDYLDWRGDLTLEQAPFNEVDNLILAELSFVDFNGIVPPPGEGDSVPLHQAAEAFFDTIPAGETIDMGVLVPAAIPDMLRKMAVSRRFRDMKLNCFVSWLDTEKAEQFAALTIETGDGLLYLSFRGTDDTLAGWKEDFLLACLPEIPAQKMAVQYVRDVARQYPRKRLRLGGHSKGGNLAVFAAARCSPTVRKRILTVYNNDGPGFTKYMIGDPGYNAIVPRIQTYIPQSSVIGMLLEHEEPFIVIRSKSVGIMQHDPYSWEVEGPNFLPVQEVTESSQFLDATIKNWFAGMTNQERNQLVEVLYGLLTTVEVENAVDIFQPKNIRAYVKALSSDADMRHLLSSEFQGLLEAAKKARASMGEPKQLPPSEGDQ